MTLLSLLPAALCIVIAVAKPPVQINGWHPCSRFTLSLDNTTAKVEPDEYFMETSRSNTAEEEQTSHRRLTKTPIGQDQDLQRKTTDPAKVKPDPTMDIAQYECAKFRMPLCHDNVCESTKTIDVFVKRVVALKTPDGQKRKALWMVPDGPGDASTVMEGLADAMYMLLDREVSVYTFDHRGTGRSARLECQATQAQGLGSPSGMDIEISELPACMDEILLQLDSQTAAFSVTSAAKDLAAMIDHVHSDEDVYVYGLSYGTSVVERLMRFAPANVRGIVLDGVMSERGDLKKGWSVSNADRDTGIVGNRLLAACVADKFCKSKFPRVTDLALFVHGLYDKLDAAVADGKSGKNACADIFAKDGMKPSYFLRSVFGSYLVMDSVRIVIPAVIYRASRCTDQDVNALTHFAEGVSSGTGGNGSADDDTDNLLSGSTLLYDLIVYSEMWESPTPDLATLINWYENSTMAVGAYEMLPYYCLFTGSREQACQELSNLPVARPLAYERDQYWNKACELPDGVTALLMTGGMDPLTQRMYGEIEYEKMTGQRMLLNFENAGQFLTVTTLMNGGGETCGLRILTSYVKENGVLKHVDTSCMSDLRPLNFLDESVDAHGIFGTDDLYENSVRTLGKDPR